MKILKITSFLAICLLFVYCSTEKTKDIKTIDANNSFVLKKLITQTKTEIQNLEKKLDNKINRQEFKLSQINIEELSLVDFESDLIRKTLAKYYRLQTLNLGYDVNFINFEFLPKKINNGFDMLIAKGICNFSNEAISIGFDLNRLTNNSFRLNNYNSQVVCVGCRRGCNPKRDSNGDGYCTDCKIPNSNCTKTETEIIQDY